MEQQVPEGASGGARRLQIVEARFLVYAMLLVLCASIGTFLGPRAGFCSFIQIAGVTELTNWAAMRSNHFRAGP
jgi:hypothetical protein